MIELEGKAFMEELNKKVSVWVSVAYINQVTDIYLTEDDFNSDNPIKEDMFLRFDYNEGSNGTHDIVGFFYNDLSDYEELNIGVSEDGYRMKGFVDPDGALYLIHYEEDYPY